MLIEKIKELSNEFYSESDQLFDHAYKYSDERMEAELNEEAKVLSDISNELLAIYEKYASR